MTTPTPQPVDPRTAELLAAWLVGDLDDEGARDVEQRLVDEPALADRAAAIESTLRRLRRVEEVPEPPGFAERLADRLDVEAPPRSIAPVVALHRPRRFPWQTLGAVAALLMVVVTSAGVVGLLRTSGSDSAVSQGAAGDAAVADLDTGETQAALEQNDEFTATAESEAERQAAPPGAEGAQQSASEAAATGAADTPLLLEGVPLVVEDSGGEESGGAGASEPTGILPDEQAVRERFAGVPEALALLGLATDLAAEPAAAAADRITGAPPFVNGVSPGTCLAAVQQRTEPGAIPVRVEAVDANGAPALVYVLVAAAAGAATLDQVVIDVTDAGTCTSLIRVEV